MYLLPGSRCLRLALLVGVVGPVEGVEGQVLVDALVVGVGRQGLVRRVVAVGAAARAGV